MISTTVAGRTLPVGKIVAVGRNYADHAAEMGAEVLVEPILFLKPSTSLLQEPRELTLPHFSREIHHEVEMVVRVARPSLHLTLVEARASIDAAAVGLDLTARDLQAEAKKHGRPWSVAKGFDGAAPIGSWSPVQSTDELAALELLLTVDGERRQHGNTRDMLHQLSALLVFASSRFTLEPGDLIFTGTPAGVGPLLPGQTVLASLGTRSRLSAVVVAPRFLPSATTS